MGLRDIANRLRGSDVDPDAARLHDRFHDLQLMPIADLQYRIPARIGGEIKRILVAPRQGIPALELVVSDGTGDAVAVFTGRRHIAGLENGRSLMLEGVAREERGRRVMLNPAYTLMGRD